MQARRQQEALRPLTGADRVPRERVGGSGSVRADRVSRARGLLAVATGAAFTVAAVAAGRRCGDGVAQCVGRCH